MARYIDADQLIKKIYPMGIGDGMYTINAKTVKFAIDNTPTADVVPKSEVDKTIAEWAYLHADVLNKLENARAEVAREIIDDILSKIRTMIKEIEKVERCGNSYYSEFNGGSKTALEIVFKDIAELKKKYTEGVE